MNIFDSVYEVLNDIKKLLSSQYDTRSLIDNWGIWSHEQKGKNHFFSHEETLSATSKTFNLDLPIATQLNHLWMAWDDTTSKNYDIRVYNVPSSAYYVSLNKKTGDINTSIFQQGGSEFKFQSGTRISIVLTSATISKVMKIVIQVTEI